MIPLGYRVRWKVETCLFKDGLCGPIKRAFGVRLVFDFLNVLSIMQAKQWPGFAYR